MSNKLDIHFDDFISSNDDERQKRRERMRKMEEEETERKIKRDQKHREWERKMEEEEAERKIKRNERRKQILKDMEGSGFLNGKHSTDKKLTTNPVSIGNERNLPNKTMYIENMEKVYEDCLLVKQLFEKDNYDVIQFKIKELSNAAFMVSNGILERELTTEEQELMVELSNTSLFEAKDLLNENYTVLKTIFIDLPPYEDVRNIVKEIKKDLAEKSIEEWVNEETPSKEWNVVSESENDESEQYQTMTGEVENTVEEEKSEETEDEESDVINESEEYDESEEYQPMIEEVTNTDVDEKEEEADEDWNADNKSENGSDKHEDYQSATEE